MFSPRTGSSYFATQTHVWAPYIIATRAWKTTRNENNWSLLWRRTFLGVFPHQHTLSEEEPTSMNLFCWIEWHLKYLVISTSVSVLFCTQRVFDDSSLCHFLGFLLLSDNIYPFALTLQLCWNVRRWLSPTDTPLYVVDKQLLTCIFFKYSGGGFVLISCVATGNHRSLGCGRWSFHNETQTQFRSNESTVSWVGAFWIPLSNVKESRQAELGRNLNATPTTRTDPQIK